MSEEVNGQTVSVEQISGIPAGAAVDGWDITSGTTGDAAYTGSGSASKVAVLKGIYAAIKAGTGGGAVTEADGANVTLGAKADAAWGGSGAGSLIAIAKSLYAALTGATPAGTNSIGTVGLNAGSNLVGKFGIDQTTAGTTNGVVVNSSALPTGAAADGSDPASPVVANKGTGIRGWLATIAGLLQLGTQNKAGSASITPASDLANIEPAGAAITGQSMPAGGLGITGWLSAIYGGVKGLLTVQNRIWWMELTYGANNVAPNATSPSSNRTDNVASGSSGAFAYFQCSAYANQAGTLTIYNNTSGTALLVASVATPAGSTTTAKVVATGGTFYGQWTNTSGTAANAQVVTAFTAA